MTKWWVRGGVGRQIRRSLNFRLSVKEVFEATAPGDLWPASKTESIHLLISVALLILFYAKMRLIFAVVCPSCPCKIYFPSGNKVCLTEHQGSNIRNIDDGGRAESPWKRCIDWRSVYIIVVPSKNSLLPSARSFVGTGSKDVGILSVFFEQLEVLFNGPVFRCDGMQCWPSGSRVQRMVLFVFGYVMIFTARNRYLPFSESISWLFADISWRHTKDWTDIACKTAPIFAYVKNANAIKLKSCSEDEDGEWD